MRKSKRFLALLVAFAMSIAAVSGLTLATAQAATAPVGGGFTVTPADLAFILKQIKIAERHSNVLAGTDTETPAIGPNPDPTGDPEYCQALVGPGPDRVPDPLTSYGLRTVDGECNNLVKTRQKFAAADQVFPRLANPVFKTAESAPPGFPPLNGSPSTYAKPGSVADTQPRLVSNLIVDQTSTNPAAIKAAEFPVRTQNAPGKFPCTTDPDDTATPPVIGVPAGCVPSHKTLFIPNVSTDTGLSPPFNSLFTFFGQFFDHGVDQTVKTGATVFVPLRADDPLITLGPDGKAGTGDEVPANQAFMVLTRAETASDPNTNKDANNTDTPWVDQSQTYTSHPSHQVFLREYELNAANHPVSTGKLLGGLGPDAVYPGSPDQTTGIGDWFAVKKQAHDKLGFLLQDKDVLNIPLLAVDPYGNFIPGPHGLPQYVTKGADNIANNADDVLVEGDLANPVPVPPNAEFFDTPFLTDIAHNADPSPQDNDHNGSFETIPVPDADNAPSADFANQPVGTYDDEMLNAHFICGDGRCNENIALSSIHQVFHSEHDRLVDYMKGVLIGDTSTTGVAALAQWQLPTAQSPDGWNGSRLFQAARFVTEMEYQHLVFEEFARKVQPLVHPFHVYSPDVNPAVENEFAAAVYRFGHSMLDDTVARTNVDPTTGAKSDNSVPLLTAFLNPPEYFDSNAEQTAAHAANSSLPLPPPLTPEAAAGSVIMGSTDQTGNEIDEFVTETLRNNLLGLPLDLPTLNMARARESGIPPLNSLRRQIFAQTNDGQMAPYTDWSDFGQHLKHPESLINFVAAYGTHPTIRDSGPDGILGNGDDVTTIAAKRAAARAIVDPSPGDPTATPPVAPDVPPADAADFMFGTGAWANSNGVTITGLDNVDLWVGGLAELTNQNGGMLGSTFNYVFQNQLEKLQDGDRLYYLARTPGLNLRTQLEGNSFAELIERNTTGTSTLKSDVFGTADCKFELGQLTFPAATGSFITGVGSVNDDPTTGCNENRLLLRKPDGTIQYRATNSVDTPGINGQGVYNGTAGDDKVFGGVDNDTIWGNDGNDTLEGNNGDDVILGGDGNDVETDLAGADVLKGGPGNDAEDGGPGADIVLGGDGSDFLNGGADDNEEFAGPGNDYIIAGAGADAVFGDDGDDWIEGGTGQDLLQGDHGAPFFDDPGQTAPGNDIFIGQPGENDYDAEGGDDLMAQNPAIDRNAGAAGFDWAFHQYDPTSADDDLEINQQLVGLPIQLVVNRDRWQETEADSGSTQNDVIRGDDLERVVGPGGFQGCDALDPTGVARINGLDRLVKEFPSSLADVIDASAMGQCPLRGSGGTPSDIRSGTVWAEGNILLGGGGSDLIEGRGNNDIIDGDHELTVRISYRSDPADPATEIGTTNLMESPATSAADSAHPWGGASTPGMTLQQAVFAHIVDPGKLVNVREIKNMGATADAGLAGDCPAVNATTNMVDITGTANCDTALYSTTADQYTINRNTDGSVTVAFHAPAAEPPGALFAKGDGVDTLWNIENLRFCTGNDAVTKKCNAFSDVLVSSLPTTTAVTANLSPTSLTFVSPLNTASATQSINVDNTGTGTLNVNGALVTGPNADQFVATNTCTPVAGPAICTIDVVFTPTSAGTKTAELDFNSNADGLTHVIPLTGSVGTPPPVAPGAPSAVTAVAGVASATVSFTAGSDGGAAATFTVTPLVDGVPVTPTASGTSSPITVTGLTPGTSYFFMVKATNSAGSSAQSNPSLVPAVPTAPVVNTAPGAPTIGTASVLSPTSGTVTWTAPASDGGSPITSYSVQVLDGANAQVGALRQTANGTATSLAVALATGQAVHFVVTATNAIGTSAPSAGSNTITPTAAATAPAAPAIGTATAGNAAATATWTAPANGGSAITGYSVKVVNSATSAQIGVLHPAAAGATSLTVTGLANGTAVRLQVAAINAVGTGAFSALSNAVTPVAADTTPPTASGLTPANNATNQALTVNATATFSEAITGFSTATATIRVGTAAAGALVPSAVTFNTTTRVLTINPTANLAADTRYTVRLTGGAAAIRDAANNPLASVSWTFLTGPAPTITTTSPAAGTNAVVNTSNITATFSEAITGFSTTTATVRAGTAAPVGAAVTFAAATRVLTINPTANLANDTLYTVTLTGGTAAIRDTAGNPFATTTWTFRTGPAPTVTARTPASGAVGASRTANVTATFSENVAGATAANVSLRVGTLATGAQVAAVVTYNATTHVVTINPNATLPANTQFTVRLTGGITDIAGNPLTATQWSFRTGA